MNIESFILKVNHHDGFRRGVAAHIGNRIITPNHVVKGQAGAMIENSKGKFNFYDFTRPFERKDIAVSSRTLKSRGLNIASKFLKGRVFVKGYNENDFLFQIEAETEDLGGGEIMISPLKGFKFKDGMSGSVVFDSSWDVIGIYTCTYVERVEAAETLYDIPNLHALLGLTRI